MYEKQFLSDIAAQNYTKYGIDIHAWCNKTNPGEHNLKAKLFVLTKMNSDTLLIASTALFQQSFDVANVQNTLAFHQPMVEPNSEGLSKALSQQF